MLLQVTLLSKFYLTVFDSAQKWLLLGVDPQMIQEVVPLGEKLTFTSRIVALLQDDCPLRLIVEVFKDPEVLGVRDQNIRQVDA